MAISPQTNLYLIKSNLELDNSNQLNFTNKDAQLSYFMSLPKLYADEFTYQRKDSIIRYPDHIDNIIEYNYCIYQNENYTDKYFYCFIDRMEYINDNLTYIYIKTDVFQTWQFDIEYKNSFVEREHVNNDTVGLHTLPENLEKGDFIHNGEPVRVSYLSDSPTINPPTLNNAVIVVGATVDLSGTFSYLTGNLYGGVYSGVRYYVFKTYNDVNNMLAGISTAGYSDNIVTMFMAPKKLILNYPDTENKWDDGVYSSFTWKYKAVNYSEKAIEFLQAPVEIIKPTSIDGYIPRNKKLLTGDYNYLYVTNYQGQTQTYFYELFKRGGSVLSNNCAFKLHGVLTPGCSIELYPGNYQNLQEYDSGMYAISAGKLPICNWNQDQYTNWLTQNGLNLKQDAHKITQTYGDKGLISAGVQSAGLILNASKAMFSSYSASFSPNASMGDTNNGDIKFSSAHCFGFYPMSIKSEYAVILDKFFDSFGYKVNTVKLPNITGRRNWNYIKTIGANIEGYLPQEDIQELKSMFNNGVTIWHNPATFLDYTQNNDII